MRIKPTTKTNNKTNSINKIDKSVNSSIGPTFVENNDVFEDNKAARLQDGDSDSDTRCICCGAEIPEGYGWVCPQCLSK